MRGPDRAGWLVLLGVARGDDRDDAAWLADKVLEPPGVRGRAGQDEPERARVRGGILVVSQFTLLGDCRTGRRPSFTEAAEPGEAERLYLGFADLPGRSRPGRSPPASSAR